MPTSNVPITTDWTLLADATEANVLLSFVSEAEIATSDTYDAPVGVIGHLLQPGDRVSRRILKNGHIWARTTLVSSSVATVTKIPVPLNLFSSGTTGSWYDPSDLSTLYQDSVGTTPVTGVEQSVGLVLDKSQGLVLGPELVTNGDFSDGTAGWSSIAASANISGGKLNITGATSGGATIAISSGATVVGRTYRVEYTIDSITGTISSGGGITGAVRSTAGTFIEYLVATTTEIRMVTRGSGCSAAVIDNISVRELPGYHASQDTSTARPRLSSRYNMLTHTEDAAGWFNRSGETSIVGGIDDPDGGSGAVRVTGLSGDGRGETSAFAATLGVTYSQKFWVRSSVPGAVAVFFYPEMGGSRSIPVSQEWTEYEHTATASASLNLRIQFIMLSGSTTVPHIDVYAPQVTPANQSHLPYQRVGNSPFALASRTNDYDWDFSKFPPYLAFDGVDDFLVTPSIDFTSTDEMFVCAGVRKLSDAAAAILVELSTASGVINNGAFGVFAPLSSAGRYTLQSRGTITVQTQQPVPVFAPHTSVVSGTSKITSDMNTLRVNGVTAGTSSSDQGTGNYGNYPLYIGMRGGASLPFNGNLHQLVIRGRLPSDHELAATERYVASKSGITL